MEKTYQNYTVTFRNLNSGNTEIQRETVRASSFEAAREIYADLDYKVIDISEVKDENAARMSRLAPVIGEARARTLLSTCEAVHGDPDRWVELELARQERIAQLNRPEQLVTGKLDCPESCPVRDPRTLEQIALDQWQRETEATRESDRPF